MLPTYTALPRATSTRSPLVQSAFALYAHQAVALHLGSTSPSSPTSSSHLHQPCSPCSPRQFATGFPRLPPRAGFHHFHFLSTAMCSSFLPVRFLCSNLLSTPFKMHYTKHHYFPTTFLLLHLLHCGCSITKMEGHVGLHTPMQPQLRAYPYAYTLLPLYYISTSLSHWLSWPLGSKTSPDTLSPGIVRRHTAHWEARAWKRSGEG